MLVGSFYSGLAGLQAASFALNTIGNNLANVNTVGFKRSQANFAELLTNSISGLSGNGNPIQVGLGVRQTEVVARFAQGSIQSTGIKTNLAIQGEGFFLVDYNGGSAFTRAGNFSLNAEGYLVNSEGFVVRGFLADGAGNINLSAGLQDIQVDLGQTAPPAATTLVRYLSNLSADAAVGETYQTSVEIFDSLGISHPLTITYTKSAANTWDYTFTTDDPAATIDVGNGTASGQLIFDGAGNLTSVNGTAITPGDGLDVDLTLSISGYTNGSNPLSVVWDVEDDTNSQIFLSQYGSNNSTGTVYQDGYGTGVLQDIDFSPDGTMIGYYSNGLSLDLARVAVATFNNNNGLRKIAGNLYFSTQASGPASIDGEGTGGRGSVVSSSLENSNVDISEEFTAMIIHQRGYQSNSKIITTVDTLLQEAINLKR
ncbi:MAG: flagellar hook protein FlgE [Acidobacteria bacterium]|nr:flagellar hook protein FlgE [Acidobacteriota bacterium]